MLAELEAEGRLHLTLVYRGTKENAAKFLEVQAEVIAELYPPEADSDSGEGQNEAPAESAETEAPDAPAGTDESEGA